MKKITVILLAVLMLFAFIACENDSGINRTVIEDSEGFKNAVAAGGFYSINNDLSVDSNEQIKFAENFDIALNGHKLSSTAQFIISGAEVSFSNGSLDMNCDALDKSNSSLQLLENSVLNLSAVKYTSNVTGIFAVNNNDNVVVNITDNSVVDVDGYYALGTNATKPDESMNVKFNIADSIITTTGVVGSDGDNTAILFNVHGGVTLTNSTVSGDRQAMIARGGEHVFTNTSFEATGKNSIDRTGEGNYLNQDWGSGNEVPLAALVIGNRNDSAYDYPTSAELENVIIKAPKTNEAGVEYDGIYVWQNDGTNTVSVSGTISSSESTNTSVNDDKHGATYNVDKVE